jgi:hypothetical protein
MKKNASSQKSGQPKQFSRFTKKKGAALKEQFRQEKRAGKKKEKNFLIKKDKLNRVVQLPWAALPTLKSGLLAPLSCL